MPINNIKALYREAKNDLIGQTGLILTKVNTKNHGNITSKSKANDIIGKSLEEWLSKWFHSIKNKNPNEFDSTFQLIPNKDTQKFPDYEVVFQGKKHPMDIKCFNSNNSPAFDIADFNSFFNSTYKDPIKIIANYFIISYSPFPNYGFKIINIRLKKLWQMVGVYHSINKDNDTCLPNSPSKTYNWPVNLQVKNHQATRIRPFNFTSKTKLNKQPQDLGLLLKKLKEALSMYNTDDDLPKPNDWYNRVISNESIKELITKN